MCACRPEMDVYEDDTISTAKPVEAAALSLSRERENAICLIQHRIRPKLVHVSVIRWQCTACLRMCVLCGPLCIVRKDTVKGSGWGSSETMRWCCARIVRLNCRNVDLFPIPFLLHPLIPLYVTLRFSEPQHNTNTALRR